MTIIRLFCGWIVLMALAAGALAPPPALAADPGVQPAVGAPGTVFAFTAGGFENGERVSFWLNPPDGGSPVGDRFYFVDANEHGDAAWSWKAPAWAGAGTWTMVAFGNSSTITRLISFSISAAATPPPPPPGGGMAQPAEGAPGTTFAFVAGGFTPGEDVSYWASSPAGVAFGNPTYLLTADPQGQVAWTWTAPGDATRGAWLMVAHGNASQAGAIIRFTIVAPAVPLRERGVEPAAGPPGTTFTFTVVGFQPNERISYWLDPPNGAPFGDRSFYVSADENGRATWTWTAPADAAPGAWIMVAVGNARQSGEQIGFMIVPTS